MTPATRSARLATASASSPRRAAIRGLRTAALCCLLPWLAPAASGDWLVTVEGQRIETKGAWEVRGRRVIYTSPDGTLSSVRLSAIDLEESERLSREGPEGEGGEAPPPPAPPAEPVLVLTDENTPRAQVATAAADPTDEARRAAAQTQNADPLQVVSHRHEFNAPENKVEVSGQVNNTGRSILTRFGVSVMAFDEAGNLVGRAEASFEKAVLRPGESSDFSAIFPNLTIFDSLRFRVSSRGVQRVEKGDDPPPEGDGG